MEEVYTCECGCQKWAIIMPFIQCTECQQRYNIGWLISPEYFNRFKKDIKHGEKE